VVVHASRQTYLPNFRHRNGIAHPMFRLKFELSTEPLSKIRKDLVMKMITREIQVNTPVERVFDFLSDPNNLPEIWPNIIEVKNVKKTKANDSNTFNWVYKMSGMHLEGKCETIEYKPYERLAFQSTKGFDASVYWRFQPADSVTHLTLRFEYEIPSPLLKRIKDEIIVRENEHEVEAMLQNVKSRLELEPAYA
jgi:uncharacterized membrane protein